MTIEVILFDLGGVLVELGESPFDPAWITADNPDAGSHWHLSSANVAFDKGLIPPQDFAQTFKDDLSLSASPQQILEHFREWPIGPYDGVHELLTTLNQRYRLAILTNTNALHWPRIVDEFNLLPGVEQVFASHQLAMIKPEVDIYHHVVEQLNTTAQQVLFLDDNRNNIDSAIQCGMRATQVRGYDELIAGLVSMGIEF